MTEKDWFKINRCLFDHPIWLTSSPEHKAILIVLIGMANHKARKWEWNGEQFRVERGQFITSLDSIQKRCGKGISIQNIRSALQRFEKKFRFLTNKSTKTGRLITIENYDKWQGNGRKTNIVTNKEVTKSQQRGNKEVTPNKNIKNNKKDKNNKEERGGSPVSLSEIQNYVRENNLNVDVNVFWAYYEENGWKKKNGKPITDIRKTLATWSAREQKKVRQEPSYQPPKEEPLPEVKDPVPMPDEIRKKFNKFIGGTEV